MAELRAYFYNVGDMLELVRYQKKEFQEAVRKEKDILTSSQILQSEKKRHGELGKYMESISHSISLKNKKMLYFVTYIWGL